MTKALAILVCITVAITGSASLTMRWIENSYNSLSDAFSTIDTLLPGNVFHAGNPEKNYFRGSSYPFEVDFGNFSGTINGVAYNNNSVFDVVIDLHERFTTVGNSTAGYFPRPIDDQQNPNADLGHYFVHSASWYPDIYVIKGDFGDINNNTGRSMLYAVRLDVGYYNNYIPDWFSSSPRSYTVTYYLILSGFPRYYPNIDDNDTTAFYASVLVIKDGKSTFYNETYTDSQIRPAPFVLTSVRSTGDSWIDYLNTIKS